MQYQMEERKRTHLLPVRMICSEVKLNRFFHKGIKLRSVLPFESVIPSDPMFIDGPHLSKNVFLEIGKGEKIEIRSQETRQDSFNDVRSSSC